MLDDDSIVELKNIAPDPTLGYEMDPVEALPYVKSGRIRATWHTHPDTDPNLSGEDYTGFLLWPDMEHIIIGWRNKAVAMTRYRIQDGFPVICD